MTQAIRWYFDFFRTRHAVATGLAPQQRVADHELSPDQHVLVGAGLDALSSRWGALRHPGKQLLHQWRMAEFLEEHGGHPCFSRVAGPYLVRHAARKKTAKRKATPSFSQDWVGASRAAVGKFPSRGQMYLWSQDRLLSDVEARLRTANAGVPTDWASMFRYGGVLYKEHRCAWVHDLNEGDLSDRPMSSLTEPHYEARNGKRVLVFEGSFLLGVYGHAINSFEAWCLRQGVSMFPPDQP